MRAIPPTILSVLACLAAAPAHAQPTVRVRAETRIELRVERTPVGATLHGTLRDDRGDPLPDRAIGMRVYAGGSRQVIGRAEQQTDASGRVSASFELAQTEYRVEADYPGDERYRGVRVEQVLDLGRAHVRLGMSIDGEGRLDRLDLDREEHGFRVRAESPLGGEGLTVALSNELREQLASGVTDAEGIVRFRVRSDALGPPAAGRLVVRTGGDSVRAAAQTEVLVVRFRQTTVSLEASPTTIRVGDTVRVVGRLSTRDGPLARKAVGIFRGDAHVVTVLTDDQGRFQRDLPIETAEDQVELLARFESDAPWRPEAQSEPIVIAVETRGATPWQWLLISIGVCVVLVVLLSRRGRQKEARVDTDAVEQPPPPGIAAARPAARAPTIRSVGGLVLDADEGAPLAAQIRLDGPADTIETQSDEAGEFEVESVPDGTWQLRIVAPGYEPRETTIQVPHRGEWADVRVALRSLRQVVLRRYRPLAEALSPARRWWAFWTARELATRAGSGVREEVTSVTEDVERAAYAGPPPSTDDVGEIGRRARHLADRIEPDT